MQKETVENLRTANSARREGKTDSARQTFRQVLESCKFSGDAIGRLFALKGLAQLDRDRGQPQRAVEFLAEATQLAEQEDDMRLLAHTVRHYAEALMEAEQLPQSARCFERALNIYRSLPDLAGLELANALRPAALLHEQLGQRAEAAELWREARQLYEELQLTTGVAECDEGIERCGSE